MTSHPPIFNFRPYTPERTSEVRQVREAVWLELQDRATKPKRKPRESLPSKPSKRTKTIKLPAGLTPEQRELLLAALGR
jgi:hypothetical protein